MISYIDGILVQRERTFVIIDVGGIGYHIKISLNTYTAIGEQKRCKLQTYLHVREDAHTLYGFISETEKKLFLDLVSVSGVGANTAMVILSSLNTSEIQQAIIDENVGLIKSIKGIGTKTAQRLILELKDKIHKEQSELESADVISQPASFKQRQEIKKEAILALTSLGFAKNIAEKNIDTIMKSSQDNLTVEDLIKKALKL